ncbi:MAG: class I tRNA ligase family protein, partial [Alphaproteobacteria bacterium]|nr:class I tRNA ligase family protein [Alphaproteobacteria bacterium]
FERRACRTVLAHIFESLSAWLAPILSFTAEEAWQAYQGRDDQASVHLRTFPLLPSEWENAALAEKFERVIAVRRVVLAALEPHRQSKTIGSSLEAHPVVYVPHDPPHDIDFAEICITSQITMAVGAGPQDAFRLAEVPDVGVVFKKAEGKKCLRCWKILPEVGTDKDYPDLSPRDADAVRWFVKQQKAA